MALAQPVSGAAIRAVCRLPSSGGSAGSGNALSDIERTVVAVGAADAHRGPHINIGCNSRLRRLADLILGRRAPVELADPRLETLRRFAQVAARGRERIGHIRDMRSAGFSSAQIVLAARLAARPAHAGR